jgi:tRNA isopentenyl-2-thiomethyl-A-37 hydroxylase MiaE
MKTSQQWWDEVKNNTELLHEWLVKQYRGEVTAAIRIRAVIEKFDLTAKAKRILNEIASQEEKHAELVLKLLTDRGITPSVEHAEDRYWKEVLPSAVDFATTAAIGAHAEAMRLERIGAIVSDPNTKGDIRLVFAYIQKQEVWHAHAFTKLAGAVAMEQTQYTQEQGRAILGLVA